MRKEIDVGNSGLIAAKMAGVVKTATSITIISTKNDQTIIIIIKNNNIIIIIVVTVAIKIIIVIAVEANITTPTTKGYTMQQPMRTAANSPHDPNLPITTTTTIITAVTTMATIGW